MTRHTTIALQLLETIPLPVFLVYSRLLDEPNISEQWLGPYLSGSFLAIITTGLLFWLKAPLNRCFIGINLYFLIGAMGLLTGQNWLNNMLGELNASGMMLSIVMVGIISSFYSRSGFVGIDIPNKQRLRKFSLLLVLVAIFAAGLSFIFRGNIILSEVVPFIGLFSCMGYVKSYLSRKTSLAPA